ncbi:DUF3015 family protein [Deltaproteobacteria bacterium TL4]
MFNRKWYIRTGIILFLGLSLVDPGWACHRGGAMGFANKDPGMFSIDVTFSSFIPFSSTSGTSGCKNWDYTLLETQTYVAAQWDRLSEDAAKGAGLHLNAFSQLMGCSAEHKTVLKGLVHEHYATLFFQTEALDPEQSSQRFLLKLESILSQSPASSCLSHHFRNAIAHEPQIR